MLLGHQVVGSVIISSGIIIRKNKSRISKLLRLCHIILYINDKESKMVCACSKEIYRCGEIIWINISDIRRGRRKTKKAARNNKKKMLNKSIST